VSYTTGITFACDRCGRQEHGDYDPTKATIELPAAWRRVTILSPSGRGSDFDLCRECSIALTDFLKHTALIGEAA
jgi:hypothetical protein